MRGILGFTYILILVASIGARVSTPKRMSGVASRADQPGAAGQSQNEQPGHTASTVQEVDDELAVPVEEVG